MLFGQKIMVGAKLSWSIYPLNYLLVLTNALAMDHWGKEKSNYLFILVLIERTNNKWYIDLRSVFVD